jgi:hypothetical protein
VPYFIFTTGRRVYLETFGIVKGHTYCQNDWGMSLPSTFSSRQCIVGQRIALCKMTVILSLRNTEQLTSYIALLEQCLGKRDKTSIFGKNF